MIPTASSPGSVVKNPFEMEEKKKLLSFLFCLPVQVKNFTDVHPKYGACIQALLDKYNAEGGKKVW